MANKPTTNLETHPAGTAGLNGIINANWERLEAIFLPLATATAGDILVGWDSALKKFILRAAHAVLGYSATPVFNFSGAQLQTFTLTGNITPTTSNLLAGRSLRIAMTCDGTPRNFTWPAGWTWLGGAAPASIAANKDGLLELTSTSTFDNGVLARWTVEP